MTSTIQVRVDDELKGKSDKLFKDLGTDTTSAIRMFLTQAIAIGGFPFEIKKVEYKPYMPMSEKELLEELEKARTSSAQGNYKSADDLISDMRAKYGI